MSSPEGLEEKASMTSAVAMLMEKPATRPVRSSPRVWYERKMHGRRPRDRNKSPLPSRLTSMRMFMPAARTSHECIPALSL
ncbi:MAG: hypothetical protein ACOX3E_10115 [Desulfomonilia bacterium]